MRCVVTTIASKYWNKCCCRIAFFNEFGYYQHSYKALLNCIGRIAIYRNS
ncbi:MAG: hypothetical protein OFPII_10960 [Osedax symbiont Rs1]|nr:MAG: hypothetical protein OFPII_10960 [Osedax symbiont Rs1]